MEDLKDLVKRTADTVAEADRSKKKLALAKYLRSGEFFNEYFYVFGSFLILVPAFFSAVIVFLLRYVMDFSVITGALIGVLLASLLGIVNFLVLKDLAKNVLTAADKIYLDASRDVYSEYRDLFFSPPVCPLRGMSGFSLYKKTPEGLEPEFNWQLSLLTFKSDVL